jgi:hypothetical protein
LWTWLSIGFSNLLGLVSSRNVAWRINVLSGACNAVASFFMVQAVQLLLDQRGHGNSSWYAALVAGLFAFSRSTWQYATQAEVFGLNNLLVAFMVYIFVKYCNSHAKHCALHQAPPSKAKADTKGGGKTAAKGKGGAGAAKAAAKAAANETTAGVAKDVADAAVGSEQTPCSASASTSTSAANVIFYARLGAFVCGLALSNQHTTALYVAPIALWVVASLFTLPSSLPPSSLPSSLPSPALSPTQYGNELLTLGVCGLAGLLPYAHLPIAASYKRMDSWGDQSTLSGFLTHVLRSECCHY